MELRLLGPIEITNEGGVVDVGGRQRLTALMVLLVHRGEVVTTDRLITELWGERPPTSARRTVQAHVSHLRRNLGSEIIESTPTGYRLQLDPGTTDADRFADLAGRARAVKSSDPGEAARLYRQALALWRGSPLTGASDDSLVLRVEATRLTEARLSATEEWLEAELESGTVERVISEAESLIADFPLRERLWELLMLALYRSGRQADALRTYGRLRQLLAEELGIDPSPQVRDLEQRILEQDAGLSLTEGPAPEPAATTPELPTGTVTFLFTDLEGSTRLWETVPDRAAEILTRHETDLRRLVSESGGQVLKGLGDGVMAVFRSANDALEAAIGMQVAANADSMLLLRVAIHTGEARVREHDYYGIALSLCDRVLGVAYGGQILVTQATEQVLRKPLSQGTELRDRGVHRLRDLNDPVRLFQVVHPELRADFPPLRSEGVSNNNLPLELTSFVGRERERLALTELLRQARQVTLIGVGGGGKTRLALKVAAEMSHEFGGGTRLVELASVSEPHLVERLIARAFDVAEEPETNVLDLVSAKIQTAPTLLLLDNCEHLLEACSRASTRLLRAAPGLRILATSRERLGVPGEAVYSLPPMSVPGEEQSRSREAVLEHDSVRLFEDRARLSQSGFKITDANCEDVGRICRAVDGIPLALELAAGRVSGLTPAEIAGRLARPMEILRGGREVPAVRHRTMLAALDWSYELLTPTERRILQELSVFRGGFTVADAETVCRTGNEESVMECMIALNSKSLLTRDPGRGRYRLLEPVRAYASERLAEGEGRHEVAERHALHFALLLERAAEGLGGPDKGQWLDRLEPEHDNIRAALQWSLDSGSLDTAVDLAGGAWEFWRLRGHITEGRGWMERVIEDSEGVSPEKLVGVLQGAGDLAAAQGDDAVARRHLERSLDLADRMGDDSMAATSLTRLAGILHRKGDLAEASELLQGALQRARRADDPISTGHILTSLALLSEDQGLTEAADRYISEAAALHGLREFPYLLTDVLLARGEMSLKRGDGELAHRTLGEAMETAERAGFTNAIAWAHAYLGELASSEGDLEGAERELSHSLAMFQELDVPVGKIWAMRHLGRALARSGKIARARALLAEALRIASEEVRPDAPLVLYAMADVEARASSYERAAMLVGAAEGVSREMGVQPSPLERRFIENMERALDSQLADALLAELRSRGTTLGLEQVVAQYAGDPGAHSSSL